MCMIQAVDNYIDEWTDYFAYVDTTMQQKLMFPEMMYISYGSYYHLPVAKIKEWYKEAEQAYLGYTPDEYIQHKYSLAPNNWEDIKYYIIEEMGEGMLFENNGFYFAA